MKHLSWTILATLVLISAQAQQTAIRPSFEVVSVKPAVPGGQRPPMPSCTPSGLYRAHGRGVAATIRWAYDLQPYQLTGMPDWSTRNDAAYDIEGKAASPVTPAGCRIMVQMLLAQRFKFAFHRETRPLPAHVLVVAKNGPKMQKASESEKGNVVRINGIPGYGGEKGWTMAQLTEFLGRSFPGEVVVDRTGLKGLYRINLDYQQTGTDLQDEITSAIQQQLGLRLESRKEPIDVIVVDRLEKPEAN